MNKKNGFTLIEMLACITILSIICLMAFRGITSLFKNVDKTIDETTKKSIFNATNSYVNEYENQEVWKEKIDDEGAIFCVSLESLINHGFFKKNNKKILEYKDEYVIKGKKSNDGVYDYDLVRINDLNIEEYCNYKEIDSNIAENNSSSQNITEDGNEIGNFGYNIEKNNDDSDIIYDINLNLDIDINDIILSQKETYVSLIFDRSDSMYGTSFKAARDTAIDISEKLYKDLPKSKVALIQYDRQPLLRRNFAHSKLTNDNFLETDSKIYNDANILSSLDLDDKNYRINNKKINVNGDLYYGGYNGGYTGGSNAPGGIELAASLIYTSPEINEDSNIYSIILYDGRIYQYSRYIQTVQYDGQVAQECLFYDNDNKDCETIGSKNKWWKYAQIFPYKILNKEEFSAKKMSFLDLYLKKFINWAEPPANPTDYKLSEGNHHATNAPIEEIMETSASILKDVTKSKLIVIGYNVNEEAEDSDKIIRNYQTIASIDNELCNSSNYIENDKNYCYYDAKTDNIDDVLEKIINKIIEINSSIKEVKYVLKPKKIDGEDAITIFKGDNKINSNIIEKKVNTLNEEGNFNLDEDYKIKINDVVFEECEDDICNIERELFEIYLEINYSDRTEKVFLQSPVFDISLDNINILN